MYACFAQHTWHWISLGVAKYEGGIVALARARETSWWLHLITMPRKKETVGIRRPRKAHRQPAIVPTILTSFLKPSAALLLTGESCDRYHFSGHLCLIVNRQTIHTWAPPWSCASTIPCFLSIQPSADQWPQHSRRAMPNSQPTPQLSCQATFSTTHGSERSAA